MLFVLNNAGVPSVARFVTLALRPEPGAYGNHYRPAPNVTINAGGSVSFSGTGSDRISIELEAGSHGETGSIPFISFCSDATDRAAAYFGSARHALGADEKGAC